MKISQIRNNSLITAIKTPFNNRGKIDLPAYDNLVEQQIRFNVDGLIIGGTTGEGHLLNWEEHLMLIAHTVNKYGNKLLIIGNTGSNNTREAINATVTGFATGMHAALQINPYYGRTQLSGVEKHLEATLNVGPAFIYNVPGRTGQDIPPSIIEKLAKHDHFIGVKECAGNDRIALYEKQGIPCWSGNDDESFEARHLYSSHGVISVSSNIVPGLMRMLMDDKDRIELNQSLKPLFEWLFSEPNPTAINTALSMTGAVQPNFRLPYVPLNLESRELGLKILSKLSPKDIIGSELKLLTDDIFNILV